MDGCPITCPCRRGGAGAFLFAACTFVAIWSRVFLGADFGALLAALLLPPHTVSVSLILWAAVAATGLWLFLSGLRTLLREGDGGAVFPALATIGGGVFAMWSGWYLPRSWGAIWSLGSEGVYCALIAAGVVNLCGALAAEVWRAGYAAGSPSPILRAASDPDRLQEIIERQSQTIDCLTADRQEFETVLRDPAVKKSVLKLLHPDAHPDANDAERRAFTERFQKASAVFDRLEARQ